MSEIEEFLESRQILRNELAKNPNTEIFIVPENVNKIDLPFETLKNLKKVIMHKNVSYISSSAFENCQNLTDVIGLENAQDLIYFSGFNSCQKLTNITIPPNVQQIYENAFYNCKNLKHIQLPESCWDISEYAFAGCENLQSIDIPAGMEMIGSFAFAGCKNLVVTFLEDDKIYLDDFISKQQTNSEQPNPTEVSENYDEYFDETQEDESEEPSDEEKIQLYEDLNIRYRKLHLLGEDVLWTSYKLKVDDNAFAGVKEIISASQEKIQAVINSGYKGKITYIDRENEQILTIDLKSIEDKKEQIKQKTREKYYAQTLIPSGGTLNWLLICEKYHYRCDGYNDELVCEIPISFDSRITVSDHTQQSELSAYTDKKDEFFTSVSFYKKEADNYSIYAPYGYESTYSVYYPYGARFDKDMLFQIGSALNLLIDKARDLPPLAVSQIHQIQSLQQQLLDILLNGTNDKNAVTKIMKGVKPPKQKNKPRVARYKKDWPQCFTISASAELKEVEEYRKTQQNSEESMGNQF